MDKTKLYHILVLFAVMAMAACSGDAPLGFESESLVPLTIEAGSAATRTTLEGAAVQWEASDQIAVYDFQTSKHGFSTEDSGERAKFVGQVTAKSEPFAALYPYALAGASATSAAALPATLPAEQYAVADGFPLCLVDGDFVSANLSVAKGARNIDGSPSSIVFHNVGQLLRFTIPAYAADKISSVRLVASTAVAGTLSIDYSGDAPSTSIASSASQSITLLPPSGASVFAAGTYYIACAPVTLSGFTMYLTVGTTTYTLSSTTTFGGQAGHIYSLGTIDLVNTPAVTDCHHVYDPATNYLQGTSLTVSGAPIEGRPWEVSIINTSGTVLRTLSVSDNSLTSDETDARWPYIPAGDYTVEYKYTTSNGKVITKTMPNLTVPHPSLTLSVDCYTAHTLYEQGDGAAANLCDRLTVYNPSATLSVSPVLMTMANYTRTFTRALNYNSQTATTTETTNTPTWANYTGVAVSGSLYTFSVSANFAGTTVSASKQVRITGLPARFEPPTKATGWANDAGTTDFESKYVRLGNFSLSQPHRIKNSTWFNIPSGTRVALDYDIVLHRAAVGLTANVKMGSQEIVECTDSRYGNDVHNTNIKTATLSQTVTSVTCEGSYGSGDTHTKVYKLNFSYAE